MLATFVYRARVRTLGAAIVAYASQTRAGNGYWLRTLSSTTREQAMSEQVSTTIHTAYSITI